MQMLKQAPQLGGLLLPARLPHDSDALQVGTGAAPAVLLGTFRQPRMDGVHFHVTSRSQQVGFIYRKRSEPLLPQMPSPSLPKVDAASIASMGFTDGPGKPFFTLRGGYQVDMVGHEAPGQDVDPVFPAPFDHQVEICLIFILAEEGVLPAVAALGDMAGKTLGYDASDSSHGGRLGNEVAEVNN
jgi:hypothetical protein